MANPRHLRFFSSESFSRLNPPRSPGSLGMRDAGDPNAISLPGDTEGPLGKNDFGDPEDHSLTFGVGKLHVTIFRDTDLLFWDYDPERLLDDTKLSPAFVEAAHQALTMAVRFGLRPKVHEAYRSAEESDRKHKRWKENKGGRAAPAWQSCHNYGMALDVWLYDRKARYISNSVKGWYRQYKLLAAATTGLVWGENFGSGDADHFEFHPEWSGGASGAFLLKVKEWALQAAAAAGEKDWMPYFWWAAGVGGFSPPDAFLAGNKLPARV